MRNVLVQKRDSFGPLVFSHFKVYYCYSMHNVLVQKIPLAFSLSCFLWFFGKSDKLKILSQKVEKVLFTDYCSSITVHSYCSLLLFMVLFTQNFFLFKGGCPLSLGQN